MNKVLLISHIADMDGLGCVILGKLCFSNMDTILIEPSDLEDTIISLIENDKFKEYNKIFITDLGMKDSTAKIINDSDIKNIIMHIDHHESNKSVGVNFWSTVVYKIGDFKPSGTSLFYDYLISIFKDNVYLNYNSTKELVEAIRTNDTYQFKDEFDRLGINLTNVLVSEGRDYITSEFTNRIINGNHDNFILTDSEIEICYKADLEFEEYLKWCDEHLIKINFLDYFVGFSISTKFTSGIGNKLGIKYKDELDFILIANYEKESFSIRSVNDINVATICKKLGGGGHDKAGGFPMTDENLLLTSPYFDKNILKTLNNIDI